MDERIRYMRKIDRNYEMISRKREQGTPYNPTELLAVHFIRHNPGISQDRLSELVGCDKALTTRMVKKFTEAGLITREVPEDDRRKKLLYPAPKAEELKKNVVSEEELYYSEVLSVLSPSELEEFLTLVTKVYHKSKAMRKEALKK